MIWSLWCPRLCKWKGEKTNNEDHQQQTNQDNEASLSDSCELRKLSIISEHLDILAKETYVYV